jgi:hypothetical protein
MSYTLAAAATATGLSKTTILKAIKNGQIVGTKDELGEWHVEPAELHLLDPPVAPHSADEGRQLAAPDVEALGEQIEALLRQAGDRLRRQLDEVRRGQDEGQDGSQAPEYELADERDQLR